jgi:hypothetical protein
VNWARFAGKRDRRRLRERQVDMEIQKMFMMDTMQMPICQSAKRLVVHHHEAADRGFDRSDPLSRQGRGNKFKFPQRFAPKTPSPLAGEGGERGRNCMSENG